MAAMKPRTGDGPLEVTKEGRGIVMRVPLEGGGRLVVEMTPDEANASALAAGCPPTDLDAEVAALLSGAEEPGRPGAVQALPRPTRQPAKVLLAGVGASDEAGWRAAGAAVIRTVRPNEPLQIQP